MAEAPRRNTSLRPGARRARHSEARSRSRRASGALLAAVVGAGALAGCSAIAHASGPPSPAPVVQQYLTAWASHDWAAAAKVVLSPPPGFSAENQAALTAVDSTREHYTAGSPLVRGTRATVPVTEQLHLATFGMWSVHTTLHLVYRHKHWRLVWTPATINPAFGSGGHYVVTTTWPQRADIVAADGTVLSGGTAPTSVAIGVEGYAVKDASTLTTSLVNAGATATEVAAALAAARTSPNAFEPVFTVDWARYQQLKPTLYPIPGVFFQAQGGSTASTPTDLAAVVGTVGTITSSELKKLGPPYTTASVVGQSGLEQSYERQLAGRPGGTISAVRADAGSTGPAIELKRFAPVAGKPVHTTIEPSIEQAAVNALATAPNEAALVAIDSASGRIIAVANNSQGSDLALQGEQPPGSTMKVITSTALIAKGLTPESPATCPPVINVDGENIHNAGNEGAVPNLLQAFTVSCNTAFIGLAMANLDNTSLHQAALEYRIGTPLRVGLPVFSGSVPVSTGQTDLAASSIGQSRVVLNPLDMAMIAADVSTGTVRTPFITPEAPAATQKTATLPSNLVSDLHEMMLSVVEHGTAAGTGLPPGTYAKTGTAEYGAVPPLPVDAWLMGFHGTVAFAMVDINAPGDGGPTDGPIIARFLDAIGSAG